MTRLLCPFILIVLGGTLAAAQTADTIYYNGRVVTMWKDHPIVEAFAIRGSRFLKVGSNDEVMQAAGPATKKVDLHGHGVTPGLIDSHTRSEEHTSELQSRLHLVCRLLLEKKKKKIKRDKTMTRSKYTTSVTST